MKLEVLIADKLSTSATNQLESLGANVRVHPDLSADDLPLNVGSAEVLVVRSTKVAAATIQAGSSLALIIRAGAGVNTIDLDAAGDAGIAVANCPGKNTQAVAELAIGLMIAADRRVAAATADLVDGRWRKKEYGKARGLAGRTLGIVGYGSIGKAVTSRARALGMEVCVWSRSLTPERAAADQVGYCETLPDLARGADVVSVHLAATADTKEMIGKAFFEAMKPGTIFINTSRGEIVDQAALAAAIETRDIKAGLDVFTDEPGGGDASFESTDFAQTLACATPHIGASTEQAAEAIAAEVVRIVRVYLETGTPPNAVNIRQKSAEDVSLVVRHYNRVGVLAGVLDELRTAGVNVEEMQNTVFTGQKTASCSLKLDTAPDDATLANIRAGDHIIQVSLK